MKTRYLIYFLLIAIFAGVFVYANFFMKEEYIFEDEKIFFKEKKQEKVENDNPLGEGVKPDYYSEFIPSGMLSTSKEYDFYYYLFIYPHHKIVFYSYTKGSTDPSDSEAFHKAISDYVGIDLNMTNYKIITTSPKAAEIYEHGLLGPYEEAYYKANNIDAPHIQKQLLGKRERIDEVRAFYNECVKGLCIINMAKEEFVSIDKRDIKTAKKLLNDYQKW